MRFFKISAMLMCLAGFPAYPVTMTVKDCLVETLKKNPDIMNARITYKQNIADLVKTTAIYIPVFSIGYSGMNINEPSGSLFSSHYSSMNLTPVLSMVIPGGGFISASYLNQYQHQYGLSLPPSLLSTLSPGELALFSSLLTPYDSYSGKFTLSFNQPLLRNFLLVPADITALSMAKSAKKIGFLVLRQITESVTFAAWQSYINIIGMDLGNSVRSNSLQRAKSLLERNLKNKSLGLVEDTDIFGSQASLDQRTSDIISSRIMVHDMLGAMKQLMGRDEDFEISHDVDLDLSSITNDLDVVHEIDSAYSNRPDLLMLYEQVKIQRLNLNIVRSKILPQLNLNGSMSFFSNNSTSVDLGSVFSRPAISSWTFGISASIPLYPLAEINELDKQKMELEKTLNTIAKIRSQVRMQIESKVDEIRSLQARLPLLVEAKDQQKKKLDSEEVKYQMGRSSNRFIIMYQDDLEFAELAEIQAHWQYTSALLGLRYLEGRIFSAAGLNVDPEKK